MSGSAAARNGPRRASAVTSVVGCDTTKFAVFPLRPNDGCPFRSSRAVMELHSRPADIKFANHGTTCTSMRRSYGAYPVHSSVAQRMDAWCNLLPTMGSTPTAYGVDGDAQVRRDANPPTCGERRRRAGNSSQYISSQTPDEQGSYWSQLACYAFGPRVAIDHVPNRAVGDRQRYEMVPNQKSHGSSRGSWRGWRHFSSPCAVTVLRFEGLKLGQQACLLCSV